MKFIYKSLIVLPLILILSACQAPMRSLELSVPLQVSADAQTKPVNALDVLVAVETIAADNGLKPYTEQSAADDILGMADMDTASNAAVQSWRHPDLPVYLTATRHKSEILVLLNVPADAAPNPAAQKLFSSLKSQLAEKLSPFLTDN